MTWCNTPCNNACDTKFLGCACELCFWSESKGAIPMPKCVVFDHPAGLTTHFQEKISLHGLA